MAGKILYYYDESANPEGAFFSGVPLADLTEERFEEQPKWLQASIAAAKFYQKTPAPEKKADNAAPDKGEPKKKEG